MKRKILIISSIVLFPLIISAVCCWAIARPPDHERLERVFREMEMIHKEAIEAYEALVEPERVADAIFYRRNDVLEISLFALDFTENSLDDGSTLFTGSITNLGTLPVTGISLTIWLQTEDGHIADWVDFPLSTTTLEPTETVIVTGHYVPGEHHSRLLQEKIYMNASETPFISISHVGRLSTEPRLGFLSRIFAFVRHETIWTTPGENWNEWIVDLACDGE